MPKTNFDQILQLILQPQLQEATVQQLHSNCVSITAHAFMRRLSAAHEWTELAAMSVGAAAGRAPTNIHLCWRHSCRGRGSTTVAWMSFRLISSKLSSPLPPAMSRTPDPPSSNSRPKVSIRNLVAWPNSFESCSACCKLKPPLRVW